MGASSVEHVYCSWVVKVLVVNCGMQVRRKWVCGKLCGAEANAF